MLGILMCLLMNFVLLFNVSYGFDHPAVYMVVLLLVNLLLTVSFYSLKEEDYDEVH